MEATNGESAVEFTENLQRRFRPDPASTSETGFVCILPWRGRASDWRSETCGSCHSTVLDALICRFRDALQCRHEDWVVARGGLLYDENDELANVRWDPGSIPGTRRELERWANLNKHHTTLSGLLDCFERVRAALPAPPAFRTTRSSLYCETRAASEKTARIRRDLNVPADQYIDEALLDSRAGVRTMRERVRVTANRGVGGRAPAKTRAPGRKGWTGAHRLA